MSESHEARLRALRDSLPGRVLPGTGGNRYPIGERLGEGGQGWVFRANWNEPHGHPVVVKVLRPDIATTDTLDRFRREATVLQLLSQSPIPNPHVVRFFDHAYAQLTLPPSGDMWTLPFTVMEHVAGPTLEDVLARAGGAGLPVERAMRFVRHVVLALQQVHAHNLVHRDLKPSNILIDTSTGTELAKVTDFGLVKLFDPRFIATSALVGASMGYAPPEQFEMRNERVGPHTDEFALAAIAYELLSGQPAFPVREGEHLMLVVTRILSEATPALARVSTSLAPELRARPDAVAALDAVFARALHPEPSGRYGSVGALWDAMLGAFGSSGIPTRPAQAVISRPSTRARSMGEVAQAPTMPAGSFVTAAGGDAWQWRTLTPPHGGEKFRSMVLAPDGSTALAVGAGGVGWWRGSSWTSVPLPPSIDVRKVNAIARGAGHDILLAGDEGLAVRVSPAGSVSTWRFDEPSLCFTALYVDTRGPIAAGSCGGTHPGAVIVELGESPAPYVGHGVPRLRALTRTASGVVMGCGDAGVVTTLEPALSIRVCSAPLNAIAPLPDGSEVVVGGGGFVFKVWPDGRHKLEAIQTTRDLLALAVDEQGTAWSGGVATRLLRRTPAGWAREARDVVHPGAILAIAATSRRVVVTCDDGMVFEGTLGAG